MKLRSLFIFTAILLLLGNNAHSQTISIAASPGDTVCAGTPATFTATVSGIASYGYKWNLNSTAIPGATLSTYITSSLVTGDVVSCWLTTVTGDTLLELSDTIRMTVDSLPHVSIITGFGNVCVGDTIELSDSVAGGVWSSSNPMVATVSATGIVTALSGGGFGPPLRIIYKLTNGCGSDSARFRVRTAVPAGPITLQPTICIDSLTFLTDTAMGGMWTSSDTTIAGFVSRAGILQGYMPGTVTITYNLVNACGTYNESATLTVVNCDSTTASGVPQQAPMANGYAIYPNPSTGKFYINLSSDKYSQASCSIANLLGEKVKDFSIATNNETQVEMNVPAGVYFVTVTVGNERYTSRIVVAQ